MNLRQKLAILLEQFRKSGRTIGDAASALSISVYYMNEILEERKGDNFRLERRLNILLGEPC